MDKPTLERVISGVANTKRRAALAAFEKRYHESFSALLSDLGLGHGGDWHASEEVRSLVKRWCGDSEKCDNRLDGYATPHLSDYMQERALGETLAKLREIDALMRQYPEEAT